jgi:hypothetical protein
MLLLGVLFAEADCKQVALCNTVARITENRDTTGFIVSLVATGMCFGIGLRLVRRAFKRKSSEDSEQTSKSKKGSLKPIAGLVIVAGASFESLFLWRAFESCDSFDPCRLFANSFNSVGVVTQIAVTGGVLFFIMLGILTFVTRDNKEE